VHLEEAAPNAVRAHGASGRCRPENLKVTVAYKDGYIGEGQITYTGSSAVSRARYALQVVAERLKIIGLGGIDLRMELIGLDSIAKRPLSPISPPELRVRVVGRTSNPGDAAAIGDEVEALYTNGPAGGGGAVKSVREAIGVVSVYVPREIVRPRISYQET
jgi:hypothetical protein